MSLKNKIPSLILIVVVAFGLTFAFQNCAPAPLDLGENSTDQGSLSGDNLKVSVQVNPSQVRIGENATLTIFAEGGDSNYQYTLLKDGQVVGSTQINTIRLGSKEEANSYRVRVVDGEENSVEASVALNIFDSSDGGGQQPPSGELQIVNHADTPEFGKEYGVRLGESKTFSVYVVNSRNPNIPIEDVVIEWEIKFKTSQVWTRVKTGNSLTLQAVPESSTFCKLQAKANECIDQTSVHHQYRVRVIDNLSQKTSTSASFAVALNKITLTAPNQLNAFLVGTTVPEKTMVCPPPYLMKSFRVSTTREARITVAASFTEITCEILFLNESKKEGFVQFTKASNNKYDVRALPRLNSIKYGDKPVESTRECNTIHEKNSDKKSIMIGGSQSTFLSKGGFNSFCATIDTEAAHFGDPQVNYIARDSYVEQSCPNFGYITGFASRDDQSGYRSRKYWVGRFICRGFTND